MCGNCQKPQKRWRRALGLGDTTLALLTALLAVATVVVPVAYRAVQPLDHSFHRASSAGSHLLVHLVNRSPYQAYLASAWLEGPCLADGTQILELYDREEKTSILAEDALIEPGSHMLMLNPPLINRASTTASCDDLQLHLHWTLGSREINWSTATDGIEPFINYWD